MIRAKLALASVCVMLLKTPWEREDDGGDVIDGQTTQRRGAMTERAIG